MTAYWIVLAVGFGAGVLVMALLWAICVAGADAEER